MLWLFVDKTDIGIDQLAFISTGNTVEYILKVIYIFHIIFKILYLCNANIVVTRQVWKLTIFTLGLRWNKEMLSSRIVLSCESMFSVSKVLLRWGEEWPWERRKKYFPSQNKSRKDCPYQASSFFGFVLVSYSPSDFTAQYCEELLNTLE